MKLEKEKLIVFFKKFWAHIQEKKNNSNASKKITFKKFKEEIEEHFSFISWFFNRLLIPATIFYIVLGIVFRINIINSLFFSFLIFIYGNLLPDFDSFFRISNNRKTKQHQKYLLLFFAPFYIYYMIFEKSKPLYSKKPKAFHNIKSMLIYGFFLFVLGFIFYNNFLEPIWLAFFGMFGYFIHLGIDNRIVWDN